MPRSASSRAGGSGSAQIGHAICREHPPDVAEQVGGRLSFIRYLLLLRRAGARRRVVQDHRAEHNAVHALAHPLVAFGRVNLRL